jgi:hypothetical protein
LEKCLQSCASDFVAVVDGQALELNAVGAERINVRVIDEVDAVKVDDAEIWRCRFQLMNVDDFLRFYKYSLELYDQLKISHKFLLLLARSSRKCQPDGAPQGR